MAVKILGWLFFLGILFYTAVFYSLSNGFRDYTRYCGDFLLQLEQLKKENGKYPANLKKLETSAWDFRYNYKKCGYQVDSKENTFTLFFSDGGLDVVGYDSKTKKWWQD